MKMNKRELLIAKIAWALGYEYGHSDTVEGEYSNPEDYDFDVLIEQLDDGTFDSINEGRGETVHKIGGLVT